MSKTFKLTTALLILGIFTSLMIARTGDKMKPQEQDMTGKTAPDFTLKTIDNKKIKLSSLKGKVIILDFWATWCPPCRAEIPDFIELQKKYGKKGLEVVGVALDKLDAVKKFVKSNGINYKILIGDDAVSGIYGGIESIPTTFIIDKKMVIKKQYVGMRTKDVFEKDIKDLL